jgi:hypothetical protein
MRASALNSLTLLVSSDKTVLPDIFDTASSAVEQCRCIGEIFSKSSSSRKVRDDGFPPLSLVQHNRVFTPTLAPVPGQGEVGFGGFISSIARKDLGMSSLLLVQECTKRLEKTEITSFPSFRINSGATRLISLLISTVVAHSPIIESAYLTILSAFESSLYRFANCDNAQGGKLEDLELCRVILSSLRLSIYTNTSLLSLRLIKSFSFFKKLVIKLLSFILSYFISIDFYSHTDVFFIKATVTVVAELHPFGCPREIIDC